MNLTPAGLHVFIRQLDAHALRCLDQAAAAHTAGERAWHNRRAAIYLHARRRWLAILAKIDLPPASVRALVA